MNGDMIDAGSQAALKAQINQTIAADRKVLDALRADVRPLVSATRRINVRQATSISLVGTDGGNNQLRFDPFMVQLVRVVDSSNNEYCLEAVSPTTPVDDLAAAQFDASGKPSTPLGRLMAFLGVASLPALSPMIRRVREGEPVSPSWVQVYRELVEWAVVFSILENDYGTDTLIVCDGLLRSKVFSRDLFSRLLDGIEERIRDQLTRRRRRLYLVGVAKHSKVLDRYRLAMALEGVLRTTYPAYVEVPRELEEAAYVWGEYARGRDRVVDGGEAVKFVGGKMFLVKFGGTPHDPVWPVDVFLPQVSEAHAILGALLADAVNGFPVAHYPRCLQLAHENAALVDFDFDILQDHIFHGVRDSLGVDRSLLDAFMLQAVDPAQGRYG